MAYSVQISAHQCPKNSGEGDFIRESLAFFKQAGFDQVAAFTGGKIFSSREEYESSGMILDDKKLADSFQRRMKEARIYVGMLTISHIEDGKEIKSTDFQYDSECP